MRFNKRIAIICIILITSITTSIIYTSGEATAYNLWTKNYRLLKEIAILGGDTDKYIPLMNKTYFMIIQGNSDEALPLLEKTYNELKDYYTVIKGVSTWNTLYMGLVIALILAVPVIFYIIFPRLYLEIWFRSRRDWVVRE